MNAPQPKPPLNPVNVAIFVGLPLAALVLVPAWGVYHGYDAFQWLWALAFLYLNGMSITGGYHRLWAHNAYEAHPALKWFYALWGAGALQNIGAVHAGGGDLDQDLIGGRRRHWSFTRRQNAGRAAAILDFNSAHRLGQSHFGVLS